MRIALALAVTLLAADPSSAQELLRSWPLELEVRYVDWLDDLDGDGRPELLVSDPSFSEEIAGAGTVRVCSTRAVAPGEGPVVLREHSGVRLFQELGHYLRTLGDVDGHGGDDYAYEGRIHDGTSGALLVDVRQRFGLGFTFLEPLGDVDHDGDAEFLYRGANRVGLVLGGTFERKLEVVLGPGLTLIEFHGLGDVDGDGAPDFVVGSGYADDFTYVGPLDVYSSATGARLYTAEEPYEFFAWDLSTLALPGDWSADGIPDLLHGGKLVDGRTGSLLEPSAGLYGGQAAGDVDGDGVPDLFDRRAVISGRTREPLIELPPSELGFVSRAGGRDWNGDGFPDLARFQPASGTLEIWSGAPAGVRARGAPCGTAREGEPHIGIGGAPLLGREVELHLSGVGSGVPAWLLLGTTSAVPAPVGCPVGVVATTLLSTHTAPVAPGIAVATVRLAIPAELELAGTRLFAQWVVPASGTTGLASSRVLELTLGVPPDFPARVRGLVRSADGQPVAGARLQVLGQTSTGVSGSDGRFELSLAPDARPLVLVAERPASPLSGWSEPFTTSAGALVELGEIVLDESPKQLVLGPATPATRLSEVLALELPAPRILRSAMPPPDPTPFELVWHVGGPLDEFARLALEGYVRAGGGLHLSGQASTSSVNTPIQALLDALVPASDVQLLPTSAGPHTFHADARDQAALRPNVLGPWRPGAPGAGGIAGLASRNTLVLGVAQPAGALWGPDDLAGRRGRITLLMGNGWLPLPGREEVVDNLRRFLRRGARVEPR